ncbi:class I SAM-dependent methyltransferase [Pedobacter sp.]|uniref:class I SAM-dependent methyltransferase n=1 Tax=Pedobacter sp. TaxID=1411316 RepID=UPI003BAAF7BC
MLKKVAWLIDILLIPFVFSAAIVLRIVKRVRIQYLPITKSILLKIGVFPITDHYYEPLFNNKHLTKPLSQDRNLPGIDFNVETQLELLNQLNFSEELSSVSETYVGDTIYNFMNGAFEHGDGEFLYNMIRYKKPAIIIEVGSGHSTKMAQLAIKRNKAENANYTCKHICIEPYEMPWLEKLDVEVIRKRVEDIETSYFKQLTENDILFIDSSHVIRPQGDVLYEYLEILPIINPGVVVHIHDIFSPKDYLHQWVVDEIRLWNEQYLLEAFLSLNKDWQIVGAVNYLFHNHNKVFEDKFPRIGANIEPGSFYMVKN